VDGEFRQIGCEVVRQGILSRSCGRGDEHRGRAAVSGLLGGLDDGFLLVAVSDSFSPGCVHGPSNLHKVAAEGMGRCLAHG
jgi:hypothetical protein